MDDLSQEQPKGHASTSFRWNYGGKEGKQVFSLETRITCNPTETELESHIESVIQTMYSVFRHGGRADQSRQPNSISTTATAPATLQPGVYHWITGRTGKPILVLQGSAKEPDEIECPVHPGQRMHRRYSEGGSWMTHKDGDTYCTARIEHIPQGTD